MVPTIRSVGSLLYFLAALPSSASFTILPSSISSNQGLNINNLSSCAMSSRKTTAQTICPLLDAPQDPAATLEAAMGWFWGPQRDFSEVEGVLDSVVGYSGSNDPKTSDPTYRNIQDYAETIRVTFDPTRLSYSDLLDMFLSFHTPSDPRFAGTQYRSAIFVYNKEQRKLAEELLASKGRLGAMIAVEDASDFYLAEEYHQNYLVKMMDK